MKSLGAFPLWVRLCPWPNLKPHGRENCDLPTTLLMNLMNYLDKNISIARVSNMSAIILKSYQSQSCTFNLSNLHINLLQAAQSCPCFFPRIWKHHLSKFPSVALRPRDLSAWHHHRGILVPLEVVDLRTWRGKLVLVHDFQISLDVYRLKQSYKYIHKPYIIVHTEIYLVYSHRGTKCYHYHGHEFCGHFCLMPPDSGRTWRRWDEMNTGPLLQIPPGGKDTLGPTHSSVADSLAAPCVPIIGS